MGLENVHFHVDSLQITNELQPLLPLTYLGWFTWLWNGLNILPPTKECSEEGKKNMYLFFWRSFFVISFSIQESRNLVSRNTKDILFKGERKENLVKYIKIQEYILCTIWNEYHFWFSNHTCFDSFFSCFPVVSVNEGGIKTASNLCPDPGEPENGKRIGSDFRYDFKLFISLLTLLKFILI